VKSRKKISRGITLNFLPGFCVISPSLLEITTHLGLAAVACPYRTGLCISTIITEEVV
jgi:hypothetical protein